MKTYIIYMNDTSYRVQADRMDTSLTGLIRFAKQVKAEPSYETAYETVALLTISPNILILLEGDNEKAQMESKVKTGE